MIPALRTETPAIVESHRLGMAEMGFDGVSEQWLMRRAGDLHWRLIARAMGQPEAVFTCAEERPLYAAFCATRLTLDHPELPRLGADLALRGRLFRVGRSRLGSLVDLTVNGRPTGGIALVSVFVGRGEAGNNRSLVRRAPRMVAVPAETSPHLDLLARHAARAALAFRGSPDGGAGSWLRPCPALDFNAAGLLYFPSFIALADRAAFEAGEHILPIRQRTVCYLGNVEPGERVRVTPSRRRRGRIDAVRGADGRSLALLQTIDR